LGYARVSTSKQDLAQQIDALTNAGIAPANVYVDKKSVATIKRSRAADACSATPERAM
jgi:DNA invertase Pin-like site-specific DNA recombinase